MMRQLFLSVISFAIITTLFLSCSMEKGDKTFQGRNSIGTNSASVANTIGNEKASESKTFNNNKDSILEQKALDKIEALPEVIEKSKYIDSFTKGKHGISVLIIAKPNTKEPYYIIQAGYSGPNRFESYLSFYVYPPKLEIKYYDPIADKVLTLEEWRRK